MLHGHGVMVFALFRSGGHPGSLKIVLYNPLENSFTQIKLLFRKKLRLYCTLSAVERE